MRLSERNQCCYANRLWNQKSRNQIELDQLVIGDLNNFWKKKKLTETLIG